VPFRVFRVNPGKIKWIPAFAGMTGLMNADGILHIHAACSMKFCLLRQAFSLDFALDSLLAFATTELIEKTG